jgi:hypothetical protein
MPTRTADDFVPSLEQARRAGLALPARMWWRLGSEVDLMDREPVDTRKLAAIVVRGRVLRRRQLAQRTEIPARDAVRVPEPMPPVPDGYVGGTATAVTEVLGAKGRCSHCLRGMLDCVVCGGRGKVEVSQTTNQGGVLRTCGACGGGGTKTCRHCEGTAETVVVRCVDVIDEVLTLAYPYVPAMSFALEEKVTSALEAELAEGMATPECLLVDLEAQQTGGPYRQAVREPEFHGFSYADALAQARTAIAAVRGEQPIHEESEIHARPILWLRYEAWGSKREVALFYDLAGRLNAMVADGGI